MSVGDVPMLHPRRRGMATSTQAVDTARPAAQDTTQSGRQLCTMLDLADQNSQFVRIERSNAARQYTMSNST